MLIFAHHAQQQAGKLYEGSCGGSSKQPRVVNIPRQRDNQNSTFEKKHEENRKKNKTRFSKRETAATVNVQNWARQSSCLNETSIEVSVQVLPSFKQIDAHKS